MSVINPNETARNWQASKREPAVQLYLSGVEGDSADARRHPRRRLSAQPQHRSGHRLDRPGGAVRRGRGGHPGRRRHAGVDQALPEARPDGRDAADRRRLRAAAGAGPLADPRRRARRRSAAAQHRGPRNLARADRATSLRARRNERGARNGKLVSVIKSVGGVGATALAQPARDPLRRERGRAPAAKPA